jgi:hypothetical protein
MSDHDGPWGGQAPSRPPTRRRIPVGLILWVTLIAGAVAALWGLSQLFPGQFSGSDEGPALYGLGLLALVSSGLVFVRRIKLGQTVRHLAIWAAIGAVIVIGYSVRTDVEALALKVRGELIPPMRPQPQGKTQSLNSVIPAEALVARAEPAPSIHAPDAAPRMTATGRAG